MDLTERIARLIDPNAWATADISREWGLVPERYEQKSRAAARRVIDGLHLRTEFISSAGGHTIAYRLTGTIQEDA